MEGPLFEQIESAYQFVMQNLPVLSKVRGLFRHDNSLLPESAVREAIANAVCHRSYLIPRKVQVALYDDRLEVTSPGTLCRDITLEKMREGMSSVRNKGIAETFIYMRIVETWGSGIPNIFKAMQESGLPEPVMQDFHGDFRITLYWKKSVQSHPILPNPTQSHPILPNPTQYSEVEWNLLKILKDNPKLSQSEMAERMGMKINRLKYYLNELRKAPNPAIRHIGTTRDGYWEILVDIKGEIR
jgi:predicted HTH transcriptional regulator